MRERETGGGENGKGKRSRLTSKRSDDTKVLLDFCPNVIVRTKEMEVTSSSSLNRLISIVPSSSKSKFLADAVLNESLRLPLLWLEEGRLCRNRV